MSRKHTAGSAGVVLSGGGAFGAYEVGVIQALCDGNCPSTSGIPLDADVFTGTSVGNFNAAVMAMHIDGAQGSAQRLYDTWVNSIADNGNGCGNGIYRIRGHFEGYLDPRTPGTPLEQLKRMLADATAIGEFAARGAGRIIAGEGRLLPRLTHLFDISFLLDVQPFQNLVRKFIDPAALRSSPKNLSVTATNWNDGMAQSFDFRTLSDEQTWEAILASAAIPGVFPPVTLDGKLFIDGGVVMNTPIKPAIESGATELHVISLDPSVHDLSDKYEGDTLDILQRVYTAMVAANIGEDIESARWVNEGIEILERVEAGEDFDSADGHLFVRVAGRIAEKLKADGRLLRKLTIHRYFPNQPLGGVLGLLNFQRSAIDTMIAMGSADARAHNCIQNGCLISAAATKTASA